MRRILFLFLLTFAVVCVSAKEITGNVVWVFDGDSIKIKSGGLEYEVRLFGIDAPENGQAFGGVAKRELMRLIRSRTVRVEYEEQDRYGRLVGKVYKGKMNVNLEMVKLGLAWVYRHYNKDKTFIDAEKEAKEKKAGMWKYSDNIPPWEFRRRKRKKKTS